VWDGAVRPPWSRVSERCRLVPYLGGCQSSDPARASTDPRSGVMEIPRDVSPPQGGGPAFFL